MSNQSSAQFRATAGDKQGFGGTPHEALKALMQRLPGVPATPIVIWPYNRSDAYFSEVQQARLQELKRCDPVTVEEQAELEALVAAAFDATVARTRALPLVKG